MPSVGDILGYKLFFYSNENDPLEPVHVHVGENVSDNAAKVWLYPDGTVELDYNHSIPPQKMNKILKGLSLMSKGICEKWEEYFGSISYYETEEDQDREV